jgi:hypothetical protein
MCTIEYYTYKDYCQWEGELILSKSRAEQKDNL